MEILNYHPQVIHLRLRNNQNSKHFMCSIVYASLHAMIRRELWSFLSTLLESVTEPWIMAGDFNCILDNSERSGEASLAQVGCKWFQ